MFHHIVLFTWTPGTSDATVAEIVAGLTACGTPLARSYACGPDVAAVGGTAGAEERYDFGVMATFDDEAAWRVYDEDPEHNRLRTELIRPLIAKRATAQFTTG